MEEAFNTAAKYYKSKNVSLKVSNTTLSAGEGSVASYIQKCRILPHKNLSFTTYLPGNIDDVKKLYQDYVTNGTSGAFYCKHCAYDVKDHVLEPSGNAEKYIKNAASILNIPVTINSRRLHITLKDAPYLEGHLIMVPDDHITPYNFMLSEDHFMSIYHMLSRSPSNTKAIFDGGIYDDSDHAVINLTRQNIKIIEEAAGKIKEIFSDGKTSLTGDGRVTGSIGKCLTVYSDDMRKLWSRCLQYFAIHHSPDFDKTKYFLSSIANIVKVGDTIVYMMSITIGKKTNLSFDVDGCRLHHIPQAFMVDYSECNDPNSIRDSGIISAISNTYKDGSYLRKYAMIGVTDTDSVSKKLRGIFDDPRYQSAVHTSGLYEWLFLSKKPPNCQMVLEYMNEFVGDQISRCSKMDCGIFDLYKILLSQLTICMMINTGGDPTALYKSQKFLEAAVNGETNNLVKVHGVTNLDKLMIKGRTVNKVVADTFRNLVEATSKNEPASNNLWIDYKFSQTGDRSAGGVISFSKLRTNINTDMSIIVKVNKDSLEEDHKKNDLKIRLFTQEQAVGVKLTELRKYIPNFVMVFGGFDCVGPYTLDKLCIPDSNPANNRKLQYVIMEALKGAVSMGSYTGGLSNNMDGAVALLSLVCQVCLALEVAQRKKRFTHYDLHFGNILLVRNDYPCHYIYNIGNEQYPIEASYTTTIIDYGFSHVDGLIKYVDPQQRWDTRTPSKYKKTYDPYTLVLMILHTISYMSIVNRQWDPVAIKLPIFQEFFAKMSVIYAKIFKAGGLGSFTKMMEYKANNPRVFMDKILEENINAVGNLCPESVVDVDYGPLDMYKDIRQLLTKYKRQEIFNPGPGAKICYWGDYEEVGCDLKLEELIKLKSS